MTKKPSNEIIIKALEKSGGLIAPAAQSLGIARITLDRWLKNSVELNLARQQAFESALDMTEGMLMKNIQSGNVASIIFMLKTRGYKRGYSDKLNIEHKGEIKIVIDSVDKDL